MPSSCPRKTFFRLRMNILHVIVELHVASSKVKAGILLICFAILKLCSFLWSTLFVCEKERLKKNPHIFVLCFFWYFLGDSLNWGQLGICPLASRVVQTVVLFSSRRLKASNCFLLKTVNMQRCLAPVFGCYLQFCRKYYFGALVFQNTSLPSAVSSFMLIETLPV